MGEILAHSDSKNRPNEKENVLKQVHFSDFLSEKRKKTRSLMIRPINFLQQKVIQVVRFSPLVTLTVGIVLFSPLPILRSDSFVQTTHEVAVPVQGVGNEVPPSVIQLNQVSGSCLYVKAEINKVPCKLLVDTGSPVCVLSAQIFRKLGVEEGELQATNLSLHTADGNSLKIIGKVQVCINIGPHSFDQDVIIAELADLAGILGMDYLEEHDVEIHIGKKILKIKGHKVNLEKKKSNTCAKVRLLDKTTIPACSEMLVEIRIVGKPVGPGGLLESTNFVKNKGLFLAKSLVDTNNEKLCLYLLNISEIPVKLSENTVIGYCNEVDVVQDVKRSVDGDTKCENSLPDHLKHFVDNASDKLTDTEKGEIQNLLKDFADIFAAPGEPLGQADCATHTIDTGNHAPIKISPRRLPLGQKEIIDTELEKMLAENIVQPSDNPWSAPVVLVTKKDGTYRFCIDYRKLNSITVKDAYPLSKIDSTFEVLSGSRWFHTIDLQSGYWQVKVHPHDQCKTAFATHRGLCEFRVMAFWLTSAPATFERLMENVLGSLNWQKCLCYMDDVIIFGKDFKTALENLREVFTRLPLANLKLRPKKCSLFQEKVVYLGHVISENGVECDPSKIEAVINWPVPTNKKEVRSFLGFVGYYRNHVPNFSSIAVPLTKLTRKRLKFAWGSSCDAAFTELKSRLISSPVLNFPNTYGQFVLDTDVSMTGLGAVLSQIQDGEERVIAYASKTLNRAQQNYCTTKRELLAVVFFINHFRHYLWGRHFVVRTDHAPLKWLQNFKDPQGILARGLSILDTYDFETQYRLGIKHTNADALSRLPRFKCPNEQCKDCSRKEVREENPKNVSSLFTCPLVSDESLSSDNSEDFVESNWLQVWQKCGFNQNANRR